MHAIGITSHCANQLANTLHLLLCRFITVSSIRIKLHFYGVKSAGVYASARRHTEYPGRAISRRNHSPFGRRKGVIGNCPGSLYGNRACCPPSFLHKTIHVFAKNRIREHALDPVTRDRLQDTNGLYLIYGHI